MPPDHYDCTCIRELEYRQIASDYAERIVCDLVDMFGGVCPPMMDFVVEQLIARMVHIRALSHDSTLHVNESKMLDHVSAYLFVLSKTTPAALKLIMDEASIKETPANARH